MKLQHNFNNDVEFHLICYKKEYSIKILCYHSPDL